MPLRSDTLMPKPLKQQMPSQFSLYKEIPTHHSSLPSPPHSAPSFLIPHFSPLHHILKLFPIFQCSHISSLKSSARLQGVPGPPLLHVTLLNLVSPLLPLPLPIPFLPLPPLPSPNFLPTRLNTASRRTFSSLHQKRLSTAIW